MGMRLACIGRERRGLRRVVEDRTSEVQNDLFPAKLKTVIVRLQLGTGRRFRRGRGKNRQVASAFGALLVPAALMAYVMGIWRLASDMGLAGEFGGAGIFSHWQVWMILGAAVHLTGYALTRYGRGGKLAMPAFISGAFHVLPRRGD